jgi:hypothetical protein
VVITYYTVAVSGIIAGFALYIANIRLEKYRVPKLSLDKEKFPVPVPIDLVVFKADNPQYPKEFSEFKIKYIVNRAVIRNKGRSAAEGCKGMIKINDKEEKVCWYPQADRYKITINRNSIEYLDVCATIDGNPVEIFTKLHETITQLEQKVNQILQ